KDAASIVASIITRIQKSATGRADRSIIALAPALTFEAETPERDQPGRNQQQERRQPEPARTRHIAPNPNAVIHRPRARRQLRLDTQIITAARDGWECYRIALAALGPIAVAVIPVV